MGIVRKASGKAWQWKFEVIKMGLYIYIPIFVWYGFNCDYGQDNYVMPACKRYNPELYKRLMVTEEDND